MPASFYKYRFVLTGGGTGGHIMPLIAMHNYLQEYPVEILYIGEKNGREEKICRDNKIDFQGILAGKWRRSNDLEDLVKNIVDVFKIGIGFCQAIHFLAKFRPNAIMSKGGYVSLPVVMAGNLLKIPILVHESDMEMGLTNKMAAKYAKVVATGFPVDNYANLPAKMVHTGIPIDRDFFDETANEADYEYFGFNRRQPVLLITGGIQGAHQINLMIKENLKELLKHWQVIHLCGDGDYAELKQVREKLGEIKDKYAVFPYLGRERIGAMRMAHLVISRASATTMMELASMGKPIILIPLPSAAADHQNKNAQVFEKAGAAVVLDENKLTADELCETIEALREDQSKLNAMKRSLCKFSKPEAGKVLVEELIQMIHGN